MRAGLIDSARAETRAPRALTPADVASLHASLDPARVAAEAARVLSEVTGSASAAVWTPEAGTVAALGSTGPGAFAGSRLPRPASFDEAVATRRPAVAAPGDGASLVPGGGDPVVVVPLARGSDVVAVAALNAPAIVHDLEEVTGSAGAALGNAFDHSETAARIERLEVLHDLGAALVEAGGTEALVERLNRLLRERGIEVEGLAWRSRSLARRVGGGELTPPERALLREAGTATTLPDGRLAVALRTGDKPLGAMRVRGAADPGELPFLELVATGVAEVAARMSLRAEVEEAARGAALAHERDRIAAGLHDTAGQLFVAIRLLARRDAEQLPPASEAAARLHRLADLADQGKWEIDHAIDALAEFPAARHGLAPALRSLGGSFHDDGDLDVIVDVYGHPARLPAQAERALYRVVHESLANARHTRCSVVRVALTFDADGVHLEVADDGTALTGTIPDRGRPGSGEMRRAVTEAGGTFHIRSARPRGVVVEADVPRGRA